jgi:hypothetical protein
MIEEGTKENNTIQNAIRKYRIDKTTTGEEFNFKMLITEIKAIRLFYFKLVCLERRSQREIAIANSK